MKALHHFLYATILSLLLSNSAMACLCMKLGNDFFDTVNQHNTKVSNGEYPFSERLTVITAKILKYQTVPEGGLPQSMQVEVNEVIQGELNKKRLWIYGDNGYECRPSVTQFKLDSNYILALNQDEHSNYYVSICGYYYSQTKTVD